VDVLRRKKVDKCDIIELFLFPSPSTHTHTVACQDDTEEKKVSLKVFAKEEARRRKETFTLLLSHFSLLHEQQLTHTHIHTHMTYMNE